MRKRRDINYGTNLDPRQIWADYRRETHALVVQVLTAARVRVDDAPEEEVTPAK